MSDKKEYDLGDLLFGFFSSLWFSYYNFMWLLVVYSVAFNDYWLLKKMIFFMS